MGRTMLRLILGIVLAPIFWGVIQFPGNLLVSSMYPDVMGGSVPPPLAYLLIALALSAAYAVFAGFCAALTAGTNENRLSIGAGLVLLVVGIGVQVAFWDTLPVWYHLVFLASIVPLTYLGTRIYKPKPEVVD